MGDINRVSVLICGQEYTLAGDMPREYIMKLADKVDEKMKEVSGGRDQSLSKTAVLAAMLLTDEYYRAKEGTEELVRDNAALAKQAADYAKLWDEAKNSFASFKAEQEQTIKELKEKIEELEARPVSTDVVPPQAAQRIEELENRCRDIESSFFDLQMENLKLLNEVESYRKKDNY